MIMHADIAATQVHGILTTCFIVIPFGGVSRPDIKI
jgi:hypothetical protein